MSLRETSRGVDEQDSANKNNNDSAVMKRRWSAVLSLWHRYRDVMRQTGFENTKGVRETEKWIHETELIEEGKNSIVSREEFFAGYGREIIEQGPAIQAKFFAEMRRAEQYISKSSYDRWVKERFLNENISFQEKKYWISSQMSSFVDGWVKVGKERDELVNDSRFKTALAYDPSLSIIKNREQFLNLHFDERKGLLAKAKGLMFSAEKLQLPLYAQANAALTAAASRGILAHSKVGMWLERIFKSNADPKKVEEFVNGKGANSLADLMSNWSDVRKRYDLAKGKVGNLKEESMPRGLHLLSESQFLSLHYAQRLRYVEELEHRLNDSPDPNNEQPIFLEIRHAIDSKDWLEAEMLMGIAKNKGLSEQEKGRLESMRRFVKQFKPKQEAAGSAEKVTEAKHKMDELVKQVPSSMQPMILRLLKGPNAMRSIHQFRWIMYNNKWCRSHGYLNEDIARKGASDDNAALTKHRAEHGQDVGRHDVLTHDTADKEYMRKKEYATHKATYLHTNVKSGGVTSTLAEWLEHEQNPKQLYWTTFCAHEDGDPKSEIWHNDLFAILTEMRSLSRTISGAGFTYMGTHAQLASKH